MAEAELGPRCTFTYQFLDDVRLSARSLRQSLFTGTLFRNCTFTDVDFSRCDFDGARFEQCSFHRCQFEDADIRSVVIAGAAFADSSLVNAYLTHCRITGSSYVRCDFPGSVLSESVILDATFDTCHFQRTSIVRNLFRRTRFANLALADCTFLYCIVSEGHFDSVAMNAESLGMIYGLGEEDLKALELVHLGESQPAPASDRDLVSLLVSAYERRGWDLGVAVLLLNFRRHAPLHAIGDYVAKLEGLMERTGVLRRDDVLFIPKVLDELAREGRLPALACLLALGVARRLEDRFREQLIDDDTLARLTGAVTTTLLRNLDALEGRAWFLDPQIGDQPLVLRLRFRERPPIALAELLEDVANVRACTRSRPFKCFCFS